MKWSWKLTRLAGIDVYVHATFFILIAWIGLSYWLVEGSLAAVISGVGFILALFANTYQKMHGGIKQLFEIARITTEPVMVIRYRVMAHE